MVFIVKEAANQLEELQDENDDLKAAVDFERFVCKAPIISGLLNLYITCIWHTTMLTMIPKFAIFH